VKPTKSKGKGGSSRPYFGAADKAAIAKPTLSNYSKRSPLNVSRPGAVPSKRGK
jgi:hypothetical protein